MSYNFRILICWALAVAGVVFVVFLFPPLTSGGNIGSSGVSQAEFDAVVSEETTYCQEQPDDVNCQCFARISGSVRTHNVPRVPGAEYADQTELARGQAADTC